MSLKLSIITGLVLLPALWSHGEYAQERDDRVIESVFVRDMSLRDFAELMTRGCGETWKVLVSEKAGEKRITFYLSDTGFEEMLRSICATYGLWFRRAPRSDIVQIVTMDEYRQGLNLYADETVEVVPVMYPAPEEIGDALARVFQDRVVWDPPPEDIADDMSRIERALDRMDTIADRATLVEATGGGTSSDSRSRAGRNRNEDDNRYDTSSGTASEERTLRDVAEQQRQSMAVQQAAKGIPDDLAGQNDRPGVVYVSSSPSAHALILRSSDTTSIESIREVIRQLDRPKPQVLLEVKVLDILLGDEAARGVDWLFQRGPGTDGVMVGGGRSTGITSEPGGEIAASDVITLIPQGTGINPLATVFSFVSADLHARIQLLEDEQRIRSLATPSLMVADNEASRIFIGSEVTVLEKVEPQTDYVGIDYPRPVTTYSVTAPRQRIGTTLLITPKIHADRTVTIRMLQEDTRLGPERTIRYGHESDDQFTSQDVEERSVTTTVLSHDEQLVAIGGLIRHRFETRKTGIPLLMDIPLIGGLFRRTLEEEVRSELLVLIRPRVLLAPGECAEASRAFVERVSRYTGENSPADWTLFDEDESYEEGSR
ncbi:MAG: hypothetical protein EOM20_13290 [Spartobacteria bacterium]|nr:hypothetical protein [Spartobacteria bacterium]